jgi:hypothetical protein
MRGGAIIALRKAQRRIAELERLLAECGCKEDTHEPHE